MCSKIVIKNIKLIKTVNIYLSILTMGLSFSILGPCLLELARLVNTDIQDIAFIYTSKSLGYVVGALLGGVVLDLVSSKMSVLTACLFFVTITMFSIPWSSNLGTLLGFAALFGLSLGTVETGSNVVIIQLWGSGPVLQGLHFTFGLGGLISPLIAAPFLANQTNLENLSNNTNYSSEAQFTTNLSENAVLQGTADITYPFTIVGIFASLVTIMFFVTCLIAPYEEGRSQRGADESSSRSIYSEFSIVFFSFFVFFVLIGTEIGFGQTLVTYAAKGSLHLAADVASYMTSTFWTAFVVMRFISVFLSIRFSSMTLIVTNICLITLAGMMLLFFMPNEGLLWAIAVIYGMGTASTYASLYGWLSDYIKITNKISAIFTVACAAGEMVVPFIIVYFMETIPEMLAYVVTAASILSTIILLTLHTIIKRDQKKRENKGVKYCVVRMETVIS